MSPAVFVLPNMLRIFNGCSAAGVSGDHKGRPYIGSSIPERVSRRMRDKITRTLHIVGLFPRNVVATLVVARCVCFTQYSAHIRWMFRCRGFGRPEGSPLRNVPYIKTWAARLPFPTNPRLLTGFSKYKQLNTCELYCHSQAETLMKNKNIEKTLDNCQAGCYNA